MGSVGRDALRGFADRLRRLRDQAGAPSLNRLAALSADLSHPLARSTISDKLTGKTLPEWDFVAAFVTACTRHAESADVVLPDGSADIAAWDAVHLNLLQEIDTARADARLSASARAELHRRAARVLPETAGGAATLAVPRELPAPVRHLSGRVAELAALADLARVDDSVVIAAIHGPAGVGKTTLAVYWAHRVADQYPDGQLYLNLRGFDPTRPPMSAAEAVRSLLDSFGIPPQWIPLGEAAQAGLFRSMVAALRVLVVLDNARDSTQVAPLLPASPGTLVVVTSRDRLTGLVASGDAYSVSLDVLTPDEAADLLAHRLGEARVAAEPAAVDRILQACARLPLALSVVAARACTHPRQRLSTLADELSDTLDGFDGGDAASDVRSVFSWSYRTLREPTAALFRLLGLAPGPHVSTVAAARLAGVPIERVRPMLAELTRSHLVATDAAGRFGMHDLLRAYAAELAHECDPEPVRTEALRRALDHYLGTALHCALLLDPFRSPITAVAEPVTPAIADRRAATRWFTDELAVLLAAVDLAGTSGFETHAWQLAWALTDYFDRRGRWHDWATCSDTALAAAQRIDDRLGQAHAHLGLARSYGKGDRAEGAGAHLRQALALFCALDDQDGQATTHLYLGGLAGRQGRFQVAQRHAELAHDLFFATGNPYGQGRALNNAGWYHAQLGDYAAALTSCRRGLHLQTEVGDHLGQADTLDSFGYVHHQLGDHAAAVGCYQAALQLYRRMDAQYHEADLLARLGDLHQETGRLDEARTAWRQALGILRQIGHSDADLIEAKLTMVPAAISPTR